MRKLIGLVILAGCARAPASTAPPKPAPAEPEWRSESWEDKHDTMTWSVLPTMARLFQRYQGTDDPEMTCRTCHGQDAEQVHYAMPHGLPALDPAHLPDASSSDPDTARIAAFMRDRVTPAMADLLGDPTVGCMRCHPSK